MNNAGISPKGEGGKRLNTLDTDLRTWGHVFHVNFFSCVILARGLKDELAAAKGSVVNVTSIAGLAGAPLRRGGLCHVQGGAGGADARDGA